MFLTDFRDFQCFLGFFYGFTGFWGFYCFLGFLCFCFFNELSGFLISQFWGIFRFFFRCFIFISFFEDYRDCLAFLVFLSLQDFLRFFFLGFQIFKKRSWVSLGFQGFFASFRVLEYFFRILGFHQRFRFLEFQGFLWFQVFFFKGFQGFWEILVSLGFFQVSF